MDTIYTDDTETDNELDIEDLDDFFAFELLATLPMTPPDPLLQQISKEELK